MSTFLRASFHVRYATSIPPIKKIEADPKKRRPTNGPPFLLHLTKRSHFTFFICLPAKRHAPLPGERSALSDRNTTRSLVPPCCRILLRRDGPHAPHKFRSLGSGWCFALSLPPYPSWRPLPPHQGLQRGCQAEGPPPGRMGEICFLRLHD